MTAIAYVDPGNFATNITAGSTYGYLLVWVVIVSNLMAMLIQYLSAKAGIATGKNLPGCAGSTSALGDPRPVVPGRARRHRDRPGRGGRRRDRAQAAVRPAAAGRRGDHRERSRSPCSASRAEGHRPFEVAITGLMLVVFGGFIYEPRLGRGRHA